MTDNNGKPAKLGWYLLTKHFQGGTATYAFRLTKLVAGEYTNWRELLEYIGENTDGGHSLGYTVNASYKGDKKPKADTLAFGMVTRPGLVLTRSKK